MKRFTALLLCTALMVCLSVMPANAADSGGSMTVTYNVESSYLINLPDITLTDENRSFEITADYVHIAPGKKLTVSVDKERTLTDGVFYLFKNGGTDVNTAIACDIYVETVSNSPNASFYKPYTVGPTADNRLVRFDTENLVPEAYGKVTFTPQVTIANTYGTYSGRIYYTFDIS